MKKKNKKRKKLKEKNESPKTLRI